MKPWAAFLFIAVLAAIALRLPQLGNRPMHNDEAVNAIKFGALWERGDYTYDPHEYHGPTLHYFTAAVCKVTGAPDFQHLSEARLRLVAVLAGIALVLLLPLVRDGLGREATLAAAGFTALSPMMVFYSRYWIHEMLLVLFSFLALAGVWRYLQKPAWGWACVTGASLGLMQATKETFVLALAAAAAALVFVWLWQKGFGTTHRGVLPTRRHIVAGAAAWLLLWVALFSSFFRRPDGLVDSVRTYVPWVSNAGGDSIHAHEWWFYLQRLFWFRDSGGTIFTEGLLLVLASVGAWNAFRRTPSAGANPHFVRFLAGYTLFLAAIYSAIPYKTPWCALGFMHGVILLAGAGAAVLWQACWNTTSRVVLAAMLTLGSAHLGWQGWRASFPLSADRTNPWVYAQTSPDLLNLVAKVKAVSAAAEGGATLVKIIGADGDYWPLPWYFREFSRTGWWSTAPDDPLAPVVIASAALELGLDQRRTHIMVGYFQLRPQVFLELYVERGVWERYLASRPPAD